MNSDHQLDALSYAIIHATDKRQSKKESMFEVLCNVGTGLIIATVIVYYVIPLFPSKPSVFQSLQITTIFTVVSVIRSYIWRRLFNGRL